MHDLHATILESGFYGPSNINTTNFGPSNI